MQFIFATSNAHKVKEVSQIIGHPLIKLLSLKDINYTSEIKETGTSLDENAWIKTDTIYQQYKGNVIAEDTGLEVMSLNLDPGVYSARYAGPQRSDKDNMNKLLTMLIGGKDRSARFRTVVAMYYQDEKYSFEGIVNGRIAETPIGDNGFGYDPIFIPDGYQKSFGALSQEIKNNISHRGRAFKAVGEFLADRLS